MKTSRTSNIVFSVLKGLSSAQLKEVLRFAIFIRTSPEQAYFWTRGWQKMERFASRDKKLGRVLGDGTTDELLDLLHS